MRPNHQNNKRMRGRNRNGGGKGPNPLSRSYESNGPDVKIRGTAQHIAEKYLQLARDAQASGDPVTAESYLQHAEHYLRLIAAAQEQFRQQNPGFRPFEPDLGDDEGDEDSPYSNGSPQPDVRFPNGQDNEGDYQPRSFQPRDNREFQPRENREPREYQAREPRDNREFQPREPRDGREFQPRDNRDAQPREPREARDNPPREPRDSQPRGDFQGRRDERFNRRGPRPEQPRNGEQPRAPFAQGEQPRFDRPERQDRAERPERQEQPAAVEPAGGLPAFITAPVRVVAPEPQPVVPGPEDGEAGTFPVKTRRRRVAKPKGEAAVPDDAPAGE